MREAARSTRTPTGARSLGGAAPERPGSDVQWLYGVSEDNAYYSHDHGFYLTGPEWTLATLAAGQDAPFTLSVPPDQLDAGELTRLASVLDALSRQEIEHELSK